MQPVAVVPAAAGRDPDGRGPSRLVRQQRGARAARASLVAGQTPQGGTCGRDERRVTSEWIDHSLAITCLSPGRLLGRLTAVSVAAPTRPRVVAGRVQALWSPLLGDDVCCRGLGSPRTRRRGRFGGGPGHSAAMIASNSACSRSSSASSRSRNCSSALRVSSRAAGWTDLRHHDHRRSGVDGLLVVALAADGDLAGLGLLGDRDPQGEHAGVVAGA